MALYSYGLSSRRGEQAAVRRRDRNIVGIIAHLCIDTYIDTCIDMRVDMHVDMYTRCAMCRWKLEEVMFSTGTSEPVACL